MDRRAFIGTLTGGLLAAPLGGEAQQAGKVYRIGYISPGSGPDALTETFRQGLREFGYVEGQNLVIEYRWTGLGEPLTKLAAELVGLKLDLIVSVSHRVSLEVKRATSTIPVIFAHVYDPVGVGLVPSLAHPGGNVTGLSAQGLDLIAKRLELLKELFPSVFRVAYLGNPDEPYSPVYLREAQRVASVLGAKEVFSIEAAPARRDRDPSRPIRCRERGGPLPEGAGAGRTPRHAAPHRPLPPRPRQTLPAHGQAAGGERIPHHHDQDVSRDGHALLAGADGGGDWAAGIRHTRCVLAEEERHYVHLWPLRAGPRALREMPR
jgi:hypothetical protein